MVSSSRCPARPELPARSSPRPDSRTSGSEGFLRGPVEAPALPFPPTATHTAHICALSRPRTSHFTSNLVSVFHATAWPTPTSTGRGQAVPPRCAGAGLGPSASGEDEPAEPSRKWDRQPGHGMVRRSPSQGYFMMTGGFTARHLGTADPRNLLLVLLLLSGNSHHDRAQ